MHVARHTKGKYIGILILAVVLGVGGFMRWRGSAPAEKPAIPGPEPTVDVVSEAREPAPGITSTTQPTSRENTATVVKVVTEEPKFPFEEREKAEQKAKVDRRANQTARANRRTFAEQIHRPLTEQEKAFRKHFGILSNTGRSFRSIGNDGDFLILRNAIIDVTALEEGKSIQVPAGFQAAEDTQRFIVKFDKPLKAVDKQRLVATGAVVEHYVPNFAYLVTAPPDAMKRVEDLEGLTHVEPYHTYYKMSADVQAYLLGGDEELARHAARGEYRALLFSNAAIEDIAALGAVVELQRGGGGMEIASIRCSPDLLDEIVSLDTVRWVEGVKERHLMNDLAEKVLRVRTVKIAVPNLDGDGVIVGVTDSGVDHTHAGYAIDPSLPTRTNLNTRIVHYGHRPSSLSDGLAGDTHGHGTHTSGSVLGNGALSPSVISSPGSGAHPYGEFQFAGMAPKAKLVMIEDFISFADVEQTQISYRHGARLSNNSWGADWPWYETPSAEWDALVRDADPETIGDQQYTCFFAAGNAGSGADNGKGGIIPSVGMPANAKNVIAVGSIEHRRLARNYPVVSEPMTDSDWQVANYSSRGPTPDGRIKPDIMAPGSYILSIQSHDTNPDIVDTPGDGWGWDFAHDNVDSGTNYAFSVGTSMATPVSAGCGALLYQWYTNKFDKAPSPAGMKAMLISGAQSLDTVYYEQSPYGPTADYEGWGMIDLYGTIKGPGIHGTDAVVIFDEEDAVGEVGESVIKMFTVTGEDQGDLKIVMAYTDLPGDPASGQVLINNLDLVVTGPEGFVYQGNVFRRSVWGTANFQLGQWNPGFGDPWNNVEAVYIRNPKPGNYEIRVFGASFGTIPAVPQEWSMVIRHGLSTLGDNAGFGPALTLDGSGFPVLATLTSGMGTPGESAYVGVRRWESAFGQSGEYDTWRRLRTKWFGYISRTDRREDAEVINGQAINASCSDPSVAVDPVNGNVYAAWGYNSFDNEYPTCIYLRYWNGEDWLELGNSYKNLGICDPDIERDAGDPQVGVAWDGQPLVCYVQKRLEMVGNNFNLYNEVVCKKWNGADWVPVGANGGTVKVGDYARDLDMVMDSSGYPVVAYSHYAEGVAIPIRVYRWNGGSWQKEGDLGSIVSSDGPPTLAIDGTTIYVAWSEYPNAQNLDEIKTTARLVAGGNGNWQSLGGTRDYPGLSGTEHHGYNPQVSVDADHAVWVAWQSEEPQGTDFENQVFVKKWENAAWNGVDGSGTNGILKITGTSRLFDMVVHPLGYPVVAVENNRGGYWDTVCYGLAGAIEPPQFDGIEYAKGTSNQTVRTGWTHAGDGEQTISYHVYRTPGNGWSAADQNIPGPTGQVVTAVFGSAPIATVDNIDAYVATAMPEDRVFYFGVRAENDAGLMDGNTKLILAGAYGLTTDADGDWLPTQEELRIGTEPVIRDTDEDGMWDGWEWYYSRFRSGHTNALAMDPLDNGDEDFSTPDVLFDGTPGQYPAEDLDGDGLLNIEEFNYWFSHAQTLLAYSAANAAIATNWWLDPTNPDSDGDGMGDGWETLQGFDPGNAADGDGDSTDGDGVTNRTEYLWGSDPHNSDTDHDGLSDYDEIFVHQTSPALADTDGDGLMDGFEINSTLSKPRHYDTDGDGVSDGDEYQAGFDTYLASGTNYTILLSEDFEAGSPGWLHMSFVRDLWHLSTAEPRPKRVTTPPAWAWMEDDHSTNTAFRCADDPSKTNVNATYVTEDDWVFCELRTPVLHPLTNGTRNLFVSWREYHETEKSRDVCLVEASRDGFNWFVAREAASGFSDGWRRRVADISGFAGAENVTVRFVFRTLNNANNNYRGWWVDDVNIFAGATIQYGKVRDINGAPIFGAVVQAIGRGGVTNKLDGHSYVLPGKVFKEVETAEDGSYSLHGLPYGQYYVRARALTYRSEFWGGRLYDTNKPLHTCFGQGWNQGWPERHQVEGSGLLDLRAPNAVGTCNFELEKGASRGSLGVIVAGESRDIYLDQVEDRAVIWNGETNAALAAFIPYVTTNEIAVQTHPDWEDNAVAPTLYGGIGQGTHTLYLHPSWPELPLIPRISVPIRDGEVTLVEVQTNSANGQIYISSVGGPYSIYIDSRDIGQQTAAGAEYTIVNVQAGWHEVELRSTAVRIGTKQAHVPWGGRSFVDFGLEDLLGEKASVEIRASDFAGSAVTGAVVYLNSRRLTGDDTLDGQELTPLVVTNLNEGTYWVSVYKPGYRLTHRRALNVIGGITNTIQVMMFQADNEYDGVGDATEIAGYTNVFLYSRSDDPDEDGLSNLTEYELIQLHGLDINVFDADSDDDRMTDGEEVGFDGNTNVMASSELQLVADLGDTAVNTYFRGRFLAGVNNFNTNRIATSNMWISADGDMFLATGMTWSADIMGTPIMDFRCRENGPASEVLNGGHNITMPVFADTYPDRTDSEQDGMWDGFEYQYYLKYGYSGVWLSPIEYGHTEDDPDTDNLPNLGEFLGADKIANTNDWVDPGNPNSDGPSPDLMPDGWEITHDFDPLDPSDALRDADMDYLINVDEWKHGCDPHNPDTEADGLLDGLEVNKYGSLPLVIDTDLDGLGDGQEVSDTDLDPGNGLDGGFFPNWEVDSLGFPPDMDDDGLPDGPTDWDTDGDGMPDGFECIDAFGNLRPNPLDPQRDDADEDPDGDGLSNLDEYMVLDERVGNSPNNYMGFPVFGEQFSNVVVEIESADAYVIQTHIMTGENLEEWREERTFAGYTGSAYYRHHAERLAEAWPSGGGMLTYFIQVGRPGLYRFELRHRHVDPANPAVENSCFVIHNETDVRYTESVNSLDAWTYDTTQRVDTAFGLEIDNTYQLEVGLNRFDILEDATNNCLDRFHLYHVGLDTNAIPSASSPESLVVSNVAGRAVVWDYYLDPRSADSDGDGFPDGFETWKGLHPRDPIPSGRPDIPVLRYGPLSHGGDLDSDGIVNWYEYSVRFLLDHDAFLADPIGYSNRIEGSTHPWLFDTDGEGLGDGDEINLMRSHPLVQDTDGDNLPDGSRLEERTGEVYTSPDLATSNHADMAMNDMWVLSPPPPGYPWPVWGQVAYGTMNPPPSPRWGAAGTFAGYIVVDENRAPPPERDDGMYVGVPTYWDKPVSRDGIFRAGAHGRVSVDQVLLNNSTFVVFGGRNGTDQKFNEVWEYDFANALWTNRPLPVAPLPVFLDGTFDAGVVDAAVATKTYNINNTGPQPGSFVRPRPGSPPQFMHYDAFANGAPVTIWWRTTTRPDPGAATQPNWDRTLVCGGWNDDYIYYSSDVPPGTIPRYYKTSDNTNIVVRHGWGIGWGEELVPGKDPLVYHSAGWEWWGPDPNNTNRPAVNIGGNLTIGCRADGVHAIASIVIQNVLNNRDSWPDGTDMQAILHTSINNPGAPFEVSIMGELTGTSTPEEFKIMGTLGATPLQRDAFHAKFAARDIVIPTGTTNDIDVTEIVRAALDKAAYGGLVRGVWEYDELGFLIVGKTDDPGLTAQVAAGNANWLEIIITKPHYMAPYPMTGTREGTPNGDIAVGFEQNPLTGQWGNWTWRTAPLPVPVPIIHPSPRKSSTMAYNATTDRFYVFGGLNGFGPIGDTWHCYDGYDLPGDNGFIGWEEITITSAEAPVPRWGHASVALANGMLIYGGFDDAGKPLGDVWLLDGPAGTWTEIVFPDGELPPPRGGACLGIVAGFVCMFGGTDGNEYFNDTWVVDALTSPAKWTNIYPADESTLVRPSARAFAAHNNNGGSMIVFGGRTGALPTGKDTDGDYVDDDVEMEIGGPLAGRDPRANALLAQSVLHNVYAPERLPYAFMRIGGSRMLGFLPRPAIADFESLERHPATDTLNQRQALIFDLPMEGHHPDIGNFFGSGFDAFISAFTNLWWHQYGGSDAGIFDERDVWEMGVPSSAGISDPNQVPTKAYGGRYCYGTDLNGSYPDDATMELYTPIMDFRIPSTAATSTDPSNTNNFYLIFHEWLDLAPDDDSVRIEAIRPLTPAQEQQRYSGKPIIPVMDNRYASSNTGGKWRRVILPLDTVANEPKVYFRFILETGTGGRAGGWYIDEVSVIQAGEITGITATAPNKIMELYGVDGTNALSRVTVGEQGGYGFELVAAGTYRVVNPDTGAFATVNIGQNLWTLVTPGLTVVPIVLDVQIGGPSMLLSWPALVGGRYEVQSISPADLGSGGTWTTETTFTATSVNAEFIDNIPATVGAKLYRVLYIGTN